MIHQTWVLFLVMLWFTVDIQQSLAVVLTKRKEDIHLPIECSLNSDISFKFTNQQSKRTQTLAACSTNINSCYLSDKNLALSYAIAKSDVGGTLFIIDVSEDTFGTYTCYETYNATNLAAVDVGFNDIQASTHTQMKNVFEGSTLSFIGLALDGLQTIMLIACIVCIIFRDNCCTRVSTLHDSGKEREDYGVREMERESDKLN